jgi:hypothetical protein
MALHVERALGNKEGAADAAHSLYQCARASGSLSWEAGSAEGLCLSEPDADNAGVIAAVARLRRLGSDPSKPPDYRATALDGVVRCEWTRRHYEESIEAIMDLHALRAEYALPGAQYIYAPSSNDDGGNIVEVEDDAYALLVPPGETPDFVFELIDRVVARRPELAQYMAIVSAGSEAGDPK